MTRYVKRPPTYEAVQYDGTDESYQKIRALAREHDHYADDLPAARYRAAQVVVWRDNRYHTRDEKRIYVYVGHWFVVREDGKYDAYSDEDFREGFGEV